MSEEQTSRNTGTSQVIHSLHQTIDQLKEDLEESKQQARDFKKKYDMLSKKHDHIMEQLANAKHESDMINALLKRKERRIIDMETQYSDSMYTAENLEFKNKNLEIRCKKLEESEQNSVTEYERLKIAYDTIVRSQNEYRSHFTQEILTLKHTLANFVQEREAALAATADRFDANCASADKLFDNLVGKSRDLEGIYSKKNTAIIESLKHLALAAKAHGEETDGVLTHGEVVLDEVYKHFPELRAKRKAAAEAKAGSNGVASAEAAAEVSNEAASSPATQKSRIPSMNTAPGNRRRIVSGMNSHKRRSSRFENISIMAPQSPEPEHDTSVPSSLPKRPTRSGSMRGIPVRQASAHPAEALAPAPESLPKTPVAKAPESLPKAPHPAEALAPKPKRNATEDHSALGLVSSPETSYDAESYGKRADDADVSINTDDTLISIHNLPGTPKKFANDSEESEIPDFEGQAKKKNKKKKKKTKKAESPAPETSPEILESIHSLVAKIETH